jgi:hypothetical protein
MRGLVLLLAACQAPSVSWRSTTGSAFVEDGRVWVADGDRRSVWSASLNQLGRVEEVTLAGEPSRLAVDGRDIYVTLRVQGDVVRLRRRGARAAIDAQAEVGAEPFDVAVLDGRVFVTLSQEDALVELDDALAEVARWDLPGEPRWLHADADLGRVVVSLADIPAVVELDLGTGRETVHLVPERPRFVDPVCEPRNILPRVTGAAVTAPDGTIYVPVAYLDTQLVESEGNLLPACMPVPSGLAYYAPTPTPGIEVGRLTPMVVALRDGGAEPIVATSGGRGAPRGVLGDLSLQRDAQGDLRVLAPLRNHDVVVALSLRSCQDTGASWQSCSVRFVPAELGVGGLHADGTDVVGWSPIARRVVVGAPTEDHRVVQWSDDAPASLLGEDLVEGRRLFHDSTEDRVTNPLAGMSCSVCHADGRTDGLTWQFADFPRQTPSLAGRVSDTVPLTWTNDVDDVATEASRTSSVRMGGLGMDGFDLDRLSAFLDHTPDVVRPPGDAERVALGAEVFGRDEVGCATCHAGERGTDGKAHAVYGFDRPTATPPLRGVGATAPYLHDGSLPSLKAVLDRSRSGGMGDTSSLDARELEALEAFLAAW